MCTNYTHKNKVAIELSRKRENEHSTSRKRQDKVDDKQ